MAAKKLFDRVYKLVKKFAEKAKTGEGRERCNEVSLCTAYAEPGYNAPKNGLVAFGNWNTITRWVPTQRTTEVIDSAPKDLGDALEKLGVELEWSDEWAICDGCQCAVRTKADSYGWKRSYIETDDGVTCYKCVDPEEHLKSLEGKTNTCDTLGFDPSVLKYTRVEHKFENGMHHGMADDPKNIAKALRAQGIERFVFVLDEASQFYVTFSVWIHEEQFGKFDVVKFENSKLTCDGPTPAEALKTGLAAASVAMAKLPDGQGVKHAEIDDSGGVEVRIISPEDFISGKAFKK